MKHFESFESNRWIWRVNLVLQVLLVAALVVVVNVVGMQVWRRFDLTKNRALSLSAEARQYVKDLAHPVHVVVTLTPNADDEAVDQAYRDVKSILREFEYVARESRAGGLTIEYLNVFQNRARAEALGLVDTPNVVRFDYRPQNDREGLPRRHVVSLSELYVTDGLDRSQFVGERAFASALLDVTSSNPPKLYFLTGHGEMQLDDISSARGISRLDTELKIRAFETEELDLSVARRVPEGTGRDLVLILAPQTPIQPVEQEMLREFLTRRAGRVLLALDPGRNHGLDDLLYEWGVLADDVLIVENDPRFRTENDELFVRAIAPDHPITRALAEGRIPLVFGAARSVRADLGRAVDESLVVTELLRTSAGVIRNQPSSWGETNYRQPGAAQYDRGRDLAGPLALAAVAERRVEKSLGVNVQGGRLIVFGSGDFLANQRLGALGNYTLLLHSVNWALDFNERVSIPARPIERLKLNLSEDQLVLSGFAIILGPPLFVTLCGLAVYFARRR